MYDSIRLARREAVRLLLEAGSVRADAFELGESGLQRRSRAGVRSALTLMSRQEPDRRRRLEAHIRARRLRGCPDRIQAQVDDALDWLAEKLPFPIVVPDDVLEDLSDSDLVEWLSEDFAPETLLARDLLLRFADEEAEVSADAEDDGGTGGSRARHLDPEEPGTAGRFTTIGISQGASAYFENGERAAPSGRAPAPRWRTRERKARRPRITSNVRAIEMLTDATGYPIGEQRSCLRRGRLDAATQVLHEAVASAVARVREERVAVATLAEALQCDPATIWRLTNKGRELNARFSNTMDEEDEPMPRAA